LSEDSPIVILERGPDVSFANCGLPYYVGGAIAEREKLLVAPLELLQNRLRLDVRVRNSVERIDRAAKQLVVRDLTSGREYRESYDKLILSPGAVPLRPPLVGIDLPGIHTLRDLSDTDRIKAVVDARPNHVLIIGAGFIGLELAENMHRLRIPTTVVELQDQVLPPLDRELAAPLAEHIRSHGVELILGDSAVAFTRSAEGLEVELASGRRVSTSAVILSVGVRPDSKLAVDSGLAVGARGGIEVNEHMQTRDSDIYAVGDAVQVRDYVTGMPTQIPLAGPANRQGRIAADHIFGRNSRYRGTQGTAIVGVFGMTAALTGASEKVLTRQEIVHRKVYVHPSDHAGYYPGAEQMTIKLVFSPDTGKLLGAQAVGSSGVDKRIDVLSVALQAGMTVFDLEELELAYAPQYGSAKDPVNMAGFVAAGWLRGDHPQTAAEQLGQAREEPAIVLDVRTGQEFAAGHIPGAVNIPIDQLRDRLDELPRDVPIAAYCQVGIRGYLATRILDQHGFPISNVSGGYRTYQMVRASDS
jgi:NADPH-dependent 2,4-dienoyl-CoA reductase/sulfur reductase-like enzyme/rhodanese-related sulfurtransferase